MTDIIPAAAGYYALKAVWCDDEYECEFYRAPIIAWRLYADSDPEPIFQNDESWKGLGDRAIECPDGTVFCRERNRTEYSTVDAWESHCIKVNNFRRRRLAEMKETA